MKKLIIHLLALLIVLTLWGCKSNYYSNFKGQGDIYDKNRPIAIVDNDTITTENFNRALNNNGWHRMDEFDTLQFKRDVLRNEIIFRAAKIKANDYPLEMDKELTLRQTDHSNAVLRSLLLKNKVEPRVQISDQEIEDAYKSDLERFATTERAHIAQILFSNNRAYLRNRYNLPREVTTETLDSIAHSRLDIALEQFKQGRTFEEVAKMYSDDSVTGQRGGDWGFINRGETDEAYDSIVFSMTDGQISEPIKTRYGYHIVKLLEHQPKDYHPLDDELREFLRGEMKNQRLRYEAARYFDSLVAVSDMTFHEEFIMSDDTTENLNDWIAVINGNDTIPATEYFIILRKEIAKDPTLHIDSRMRREIVNNISYAYLLISEARKNGFNKSDEYIQAMDDFIYQEKLNRLLLEKNPDSDYEPSDSAIAAYYRSHKKDFSEDTALSIQQLLVETQDEANRAMAELDSGANFYQTALKYFPGDDTEIKELAINLGWITRDDFSDNFFNEIYKYDVGQISKPIKSEWGYHIVKILGKKGVKPLESVRVNIRKALVDSVKTTALNNWNERMLDGMNVKVDEKLLNEFMFQVDWMPKPDFTKMFPKY